MIDQHRLFIYPPVHPAEEKEEAEAPLKEWNFQGTVCQDIIRLKDV